jgi:hypothetical protein
LWQKPAARLAICGWVIVSRLKVICLAVIVIHAAVGINNHVLLTDRSE